MAAVPQDLIHLDGATPIHDHSVIFGDPKTIYVVSPQPWNGIKVSKHHYATELARLGHEVFFIEPPCLDGKFGHIQVQRTEVLGVSRVSYRPWFPYRIKFRARALFDFGMRRQARLIRRAIGQEPDVVWDFDNSYQFADLRAFGGALKIFHPVDDLMVGRSSDKGADLLLAVSKQFIDSLKTTNCNLLLVPHGLNRDHSSYAEAVIQAGGHPRRPSDRPLIGYVGHLDHPEFDWDTTFSLIESNPSLDFVFIGPFTLQRAGAMTPAARLRNYANCNLTGLLSPTEILAWADRVDVWTLIFHCAPEIGGRIDSHKLLEYLATGKTVLSTKVLPYVGSNLLFMASDHTNRELPALLRDIVANLSDMNAPARQIERCAFALEHSYVANLRKVDALAVHHLAR